MGPAFPTYAACEQEMIAKIKHMEKPMRDGKTNVQGDSVITQGDGSAAFVTYFFCYPDTMDPRGPEGK